MRKHIYVAGPLSGDFDGNRDRAIDAADQLLAVGLYPFVPHLIVEWHRRHPHHYEVWMVLDFAWIRRCDALYRMPGPSPGADREVAFAHELGLPVFHTISDVIVWAKEDE